MTGQELKRARLAKKWSQCHTAKFLGVSQGYLSLLENSQRAVPEKLFPKLLRVFEMPPTALPLEEPEKTTPTLHGHAFAKYLGAFGYPGFSHLKNRADRNPANVLLDALMQNDLDTRVAEGLPWLALNYTEMNWDWLLRNAKLNSLQNRLGFVLTLARKVAKKANAEKEAQVLGRWEALLEPARLAREDTFCHDSLTSAERRWLRENRSTEAKHWNLLTDLAPNQLTYDA